MNNMERFTQRARRVLTLAEESAVQLKQPIIGSQHMLLGLLQEVHGVASRVLRDLGVEQKRVLELIIELTPPNDPNTPPAAAQLAPETQHLIELAVDEARQMGHFYIGTEHMLLGLVRQEDSMAVRILKRFDISLDQVREQTERMIQEIPPLKREKSGDVEVIESYARQELSPAEPANPSTDLNTVIVTKVLAMLGENKLTNAQASELLHSLPLDMTLSPAGKANFASMVNRTGVNMNRRVRVTVYDSATRQAKFEIVNSLDAMLRFIDHFLQLVSDNDFESLVLDGDNSPIATELRIEKDEPNE